MHITDETNLAYGSLKRHNIPRAFDSHILQAMIAVILRFSAKESIILVY